MGDLFDEAMRLAEESLLPPADPPALARAYRAALVAGLNDPTVREELALMRELLKDIGPSGS